MTTFEKITLVLQIIGLLMSAGSLTLALHPLRSGCFSLCIIYTIPQENTRKTSNELRVKFHQKANAYTKKR